jgi:hypothetical protein
MGTRADFYVGRGPEAEWLGSIAWDGYDVPLALREAQTEADFRLQVDAFLKTRDDATWPAEGWPWPWDTSELTDCAYAFDTNAVFEEYAGYWFSALSDNNEREVMLERGPADLVRCTWPDMAARKKVKLGGPGSGIILISG